MHFEYKVVNTDFRIGSCKLVAIPEDYKKKLEEEEAFSENLAVFYDKRDDFLMLVEDNPMYEYYKAILPAYMSLRKETRYELLNDPDATWKHLLMIIEGVLRYRKEYVLSERETKSEVDDKIEVVLKKAERKTAGKMINQARYMVVSGESVVVTGALMDKIRM